MRRGVRYSPGLPTASDKSHEYKRVGFIGISNWALDPAKTNRGILGMRLKFNNLI